MSGQYKQIFVVAVFIVALVVARYGRALGGTYTKDRKKNICDIATTPPMKKPTAIELWNLRIIIVPPILNAKSIRADQTDVKPSARDRVPMTAHAINARTPVKPRIEYLGIFCYIIHTREASKYNRGQKKNGFC